MTYLVGFAALAAVAVLLRGAGAGWPWRQASPGRATGAFVLSAVGLATIVASPFVPWARWIYLLLFGAFAGLAACWIAPHARTEERLIFTAAWGWLLFKLFAIPIR